MLKSNNQGNLFCFGLGYSAQFLAKRLIPKNWLVSGSYRDSNAITSIKEIGVSVYLYDGNRVSSKILDAIHKATHILISIPPQESGDVVLQHFGSIFLKSKHLKWVGYISSTGVYGDSNGEWVDETSPLKPITFRGQRRVEVESDWLKLQKDYNLPVIIFRCVGIYGPERNLLVSIQQGRAKNINKPGLMFSRIHVEDLVQTFEASMQSIRPGAIYNVSDDYPSPPSAAIEYACSLLNIKPLQPISYESAVLSEMARSFYQANKRVSNKKIKKELGINLQYPDYRSGLKALLNE
ncbi:MAG: SDR family oxidoreductase [Nitrospina sp.]|jgi:nucleoside-diphosphate-sugar epimerase|nr:SDR family oxidoreductase [Nitrospina sp.]